MARVKAVCTELLVYLALVFDVRLCACLWNVLFDGLDFKMDLLAL